MLLLFRTYQLNLNHVSQPHSSPQSLINKQMEIFSVCVCVYVCICMCVWYFIIFVDDWKNRIQCLETAFLLSSALPNKARKSQSNTQSNHNICFIPILGNSFPNVSSFIVFPFESVLMRWRKLEPITQSKVSQKEKHQYSILTHIYGIQKDGNSNPIREIAKETQMQRTVFWTLWEKARV